MVIPVDHMLVIGLEVINYLFWPIRCEGRSAGVEVGGLGKGFLVCMKDVPEETIHFLTLDIILFVYFIWNYFLFYQQSKDEVNTEEKASKIITGKWSWSPSHITSEITLTLNFPT